MRQDKSELESSVHAPAGSHTAEPSIDLSHGRYEETEALLRSIAKAVKPFKAGVLAKASLSQLLVYLDDHALSGSLWLHDQDHDSTVVFVQGAPAKVRTTQPVPPLGQILVEQGLVDQRASDETFAFARRGGGLHGAMLVASGLVGQHDLEGGLREQTGRRLIEIFQSVGPKTRFAFYRDVDLLVTWGGTELTPIDPWWLLWRGNRDREVDAPLRAVLQSFRKERLILHEGVDLDRFGFDEPERSLLSRWSGRSATVDLLLVQPGQSKTRIAHMIVVLFLTHNLSYDDPAPTSVRPTPATRVPAADPAAAERPAHQAQAPIQQEAPRRRPSAHGKARMTKTFQSVIEPVVQQAEAPDPERRHTHSELDLSRCAEALKLSQQAQEALDRKQYTQAERLASSALELLPENASLKTEYAWIASHLPARRRIGDVGDLLDMVKDAIQSEPALDRAYFVRGTIFEYLGLHAKAYADYRTAFARNARNAEAAERLREYVRRIKETGSPEPDGGATHRPSGAGTMGAISKLWKRS